MPASAKTILIRPVAPGDQAVIAQMWQALSDDHVHLDSRFPATVPGAAERYAERMIEVREDEDTRAFVAEVEGQVVGYVLGATIDLSPDLFEHEDIGFIADIYVEPTHRRQGVARRLFDAMCEWFEMRHVRHIEWQVAVANQEARHFWTAVGGRALTMRMRFSRPPE